MGAGRRRRSPTCVIHDPHTTLLKSNQFQSKMRSGEFIMTDGVPNRAASSAPCSMDSKKRVLEMSHRPHFPPPAAIIAVAACVAAVSAQPTMNIVQLAESVPSEFGGVVVPQSARAEEEKVIFFAAPESTFFSHTPSSVPRFTPQPCVTSSMPSPLVSSGVGSRLVVVGGISQKHDVITAPATSETPPVRRWCGHKSNLRPPRRPPSQPH